MDASQNVTERKTVTMLEMPESVLKKMLDQAAEVAGKTAIQVYIEQHDAQEKEKFDFYLFNTKLLLEQYRGIKEYIELRNEELQIEEEECNLEELMQDYIHGHMEQDAKEKLRRAKNTERQIAEIDMALSVYKRMCETSSNQDEIRKYRVIEMLYLNEEQKTFDEIAEECGIVTRTVARDRDEAVEKITCILFGIDGLNQYMRAKREKKKRRKPAVKK